MRTTLINIIIFFKITKRKIMELFRYDSKILSFMIFLVYITCYMVAKLTKGQFKALIFAGRIFRHINSEFARNFAQSKLTSTIKRYGVQKVGEEMRKIVKNNINNEIKNRLKTSVIKGEIPLFDKRLIILSPFVNGKKGVILIKYTEYFKYFIDIFNVKKISKNYVLIIEPSWSGYFDEDILCLLFKDIPIIIEALEPIDSNFIESLKANFYPVDIGSNCWVNPNVFFPIPKAKKKYDVIMVGLWADVKRHYHLFEALSKCRRKLKVALVGQPWPKTLDEIKAEARYYGVIDQIEFFENISQSQLNILFNQSKCALLLSKKEGFNKSIVEAMYANTPAFILEGFNYGYRYPFINEKTGGFIKPNELTNFLENLDKILIGFEPAKWIKKYVSPEISTEKFIEVLREIEMKEKIIINKNLAVKVNSPDLDYLEPEIWEKMKSYYKQLKCYLRC